MTWYCYILRTTNEKYKNQTYNGSTNNLKRRLRQHNSEIKGGAKFTNNKGPWEYYAILTGFETHQEALYCEWKIKHPTNQKRRPKKYCGIIGRIDSFNIILNLDNWTNKCKINNVGLCTNKEYIIYLASDIINIIDINNIKKNILIKNLDEIHY